MKRIYIIAIGCIAALNFSCRKLIEADAPIDRQSASYIYSNNAAAAQASTGIYYWMSEANLTYKNSITQALLSDEIELHNIGNIEYAPLYTNTLSGSSNTMLWSDFYSLIFKVNAALEGIGASTGVTTAFRQQFVGEMRFLRAYAYFNLINCYGPVPLLTGTDYQVNYLKNRSSESEVIAFVQNELEAAKDVVAANYVAADLLSSGNNRIHINKAVVATLQSKVSLYQRDWVKAEQFASEVISNGSYRIEEELGRVFLAESKEAIWQVAPIDVDWGTTEARNFLLPDTGPDMDRKIFYLNKDLVGSFETGDLRKQFWINRVTTAGGDFDCPTKYKQENKDSGSPFKELSMVFRLAEVFLIRAEARAEMGKLTGPESAEEDLQKIRNRAGLTGPIPDEKSALLKMIAQERRHELFTEMGNRWQDLKRTGELSVIMPAAAVHKGGSWQATDQLFPIPEADLLRAPNLKPQNPGY